ncbi:hypothetical protein [Methylotenera sp.]|uniref:hypothetical protein n=1 Tax=Methylotenera sp. TaxID=2051956 RepID=UPI0027343495|nr:hypothetical protein [Methylotenera sp.]MDP3211254.1 hypothetical protein [Methylotenera sp.]
MSVKTAAEAARLNAKGARSAEAEIVCGIQRGCEYRATQQFARVGTYSAFP